MDTKHFVVLEAIRRTTRSVPYPLDGDWLPLAEPIEVLHGEGLLEIKGNSYQITKEGKKAIMLYNSECKDILRHFKDYKNVYGEDLRLFAACSGVSAMVSTDVLLEYLKNLHVLIVWEGFFDNVKDTVNWQKNLLERFEEECKKEIGKDMLEKAEEISQRNKSMVQVTRI